MDWRIDKKSLYAVVTVALIGAGTTIFAYESTKKSYRAEGFNHGSIMQREGIIEKLNSIKKIENCSQSSSELIELFSVKATSVYVQKTNGVGFHFCMMR